MQAGVGLLDMDLMPILHNHCLGYRHNFILFYQLLVITLRFSINCSTVICSPTVLFAFKREASGETYGPRVYFPSYTFRSIYQKQQKYLVAIYLLFFCFTFWQSYIPISMRS